MRTTLDIDDDVLAAAKELGRAEGKTAGQVLSELARRALTTASAAPGGFAERQAGYAPLWHTLPGREGAVVTPEQIQRIQVALDLEDATPWDHETDQPRKLE